MLASSCLSFSTTALPDVVGPVDMLVVAGGRDMDEACADEELLGHVRRLAGSARRITSVCSGGFVLAATGLRLEAACQLLETTSHAVDTSRASAGTACRRR